MVQRSQMDMVYLLRGGGGGGKCLVPKIEGGHVYIILQGGACQFSGGGGGGGGGQINLQKPPYNIHGPSECCGGECLRSVLPDTQIPSLRRVPHQ